VVMGARPPVDSIHAAGRRLFANSTSDRKGLAREKPSKAVTKRKGKTSQEAPTLRHSPLSLSDDSGDSDSDGPPNIPIGRPPAREFKVVQLPKQQKVVKSKEVISLTSSDAQSGSEDETTKKADSDYEDKATSKKRKAKSEGGSRAAKKRASSTETPVPKVNKDKAPTRTKGGTEKVRKPKIIESSDDEMLGDAAKHLCDGPPKLKGVKGIVLIRYPLTSRLTIYLERPKPRPVKPPVACEENDSTNKTVLDNTELAACATPGHAELDDRLPPRPKSPASPSPMRRQPSRMLTDHVVPAAGAPESVAPASSDNVTPAPTSPNDEQSGENVDALVQQGDLATERAHDANVRQDLVQADEGMYGPRQGLRMEPHYHSTWNDPPYGDSHPHGPGRGFPRYPPSDYQRGYYDQRMQHGPPPPRGSQPPQPSRGSQPPPSRSSQPPRGSQPPQQYDETHYRGGGYHDGHYHDHDPREYREDYWHPSSNPYYGSGGGGYHMYGPDYSDDQTDL
jgi:hypothetical protein